ncbi:MAG: isochorismate synthase [Bacteroidetes bacterium]|nr:isochorismate synthase [Bacteroidota bacterium]
MKEIITDFIESFKIFYAEKINTSKAKLKKNSLVSFAYLNKEIDFNKIFENIGLFSPSFIFEKPDEDFKILAFDTIYSFNDEIKNDAIKISSFINELRENTIENWGKELSKNIPLFVGGMKFLKDNNSELWKDFNESNWFIPKYLFIKKGNFSGLIFNTFYNSLKNIDKEIIIIQNDLNNLFKETEVFLSNNSIFENKISSNGKVEKQVWINKVENILNLIRKKEIDKVVLSRKISLKLNNKPNWNDIHKKLTTNFPTCHFFIFHKNDSFFFGSTPERLAKFSNGMVEIDALAGSAPRGINDKEDKFFEDKLLNSQKDINEHNFVIDHIIHSIENTTENIEIQNKYEIKKLNNIQHLHSRISAKLKCGFTPFDLLMKLYPTPAICGVSREKAFSIINEYEDYERGMYSGVVGWFNFYNEGEFTVALRSAVTDGKELTAFAGSGIVASSNPNTEFEETEIKLKAILNLFDEKN